MANNLRPRYGIPAGGFDSSRRPSAPSMYSVPVDKNGLPAVVHHDMVREMVIESSKLHPFPSLRDPCLDAMRCDACIRASHKKVTSANLYSHWNLQA